MASHGTTRENPIEIDDDSSPEPTPRSQSSKNGDLGRVVSAGPRRRERIEPRKTATVPPTSTSSPAIHGTKVTTGQSTEAISLPNNPASRQPILTSRSPASSVPRRENSVMSAVQSKGSPKAGSDMKPPNKKIARKSVRSQVNIGVPKAPVTSSPSPVGAALPIRAPKNIASTIPTTLNNSRKASPVTAEKAKKPRTDIDNSGEVPDIQSRLSAQIDSNAEEMIEACLLKYLIELHEDHARAVKSCMTRQRTSLDREPQAPKKSSTSRSSRTQTTDPFEDMVPVELAAIQKTKDRHSVIKPDATTVPFYKEIVYLRNNVLAENKRILLYNPYFADDQFKDNTKRTLETELEDVYDMQDDRSLDLLHAEQYRVYGVHINRFIQELGISWDAVLYWFLASEEDIMRRLENFAGNIEPLLSERDLIREYRHKPKWQAVLKLLPDQDCDVLCLSALACKVFSTQQGFSMWQLARQSEIAQTHLRKAIQGSQANPEPKEEATFRAKTCRICYEWNCPFHGEMLGSPYSNSDDNSDDDSSDSSSDSSIDVAINSRRLVCSNGLSRKARLDEQGSYQPPRRKRFDVRRWIERTKTATLEKRRTFYPCNHEGSCKTAQCSCFREDILCEKTCNCHASCQRRYPGCSCKPGMNDNVCAPDDDWCECRQLNRECDADLCANCGATEALNPVNRYTKDKRGGSDRCCNVAIQKGEPVKTYMGNSQTHGWGLYTGVPVKAHDFLGEYHGELVTHDEADRRGTIYAYQKTEYLFNLNGEQQSGGFGQEIDATRAGNKTRYINHARKQHANCYAKALLCNSVLRIGLFAQRNLTAGAELFFDYGEGYDEMKTKEFKQPPQVTTGKGTMIENKKSSQQLPVTNTGRQPATKTRGENVARAARKSDVSFMLPLSPADITRKARKSAIGTGTSLTNRPRLVSQTRNAVRQGRSKADEPSSLNRPSDDMQSSTRESDFHFEIRSDSEDDTFVDDGQSDDEGEQSDRSRNMSDTVSSGGSSTADTRSKSNHERMGTRHQSRGGRVRRVSMRAATATAPGLVADGARVGPVTRRKRKRAILDEEDEDGDG